MKSLLQRVAGIPGMPLWVLEATHERRRLRAIREDIQIKFGYIPPVGDMVCDCKYRHLRIISQDADLDGVQVEDGGWCSLIHCCDDPNVGVHEH
jgi:hypothetical protein